MREAVDAERVRLLRVELVSPGDGREGLLSFRHFDPYSPELYRFPAVDPPSFRRRVEELGRG